MSITAFPLCWPEGWPRQSYRVHPRYPFKGNTFAKARDSLGHELELLGARDIILSTNVELRFDGQPRGDSRDYLPDPGVAVYFTLRKRPMAMARDAYPKVSDNMRSLAMAVEHLRGLERHGGATMVERAFTGFAALPAPGAKRSCWEVLGLRMVEVVGSTDQRVAMIDGAYRAKARIHHPDVSGSDAQMAEVNAARDDALRQVGAR